MATSEYYLNPRFFAFAEKRTMADLLTTENLIALFTLTSMEVVLGIDNIVMIAILTGKLPEDQRPKARSLGIALALGSRLLLLLSLSWIMGLTKGLFTVREFEVTGRHLVLLIGGLFLIAKATYEIHHKLEDPKEVEVGSASAKSLFSKVIIQIIMIDVIFSLDSVITAVGMVKEIAIMVVAVIVSVGVMLAFAGRVSAFIERHPTVKILALSFMLLIGVMLTAEGVGRHVEKGYIYFAMAFSLFVEVLNIKATARKAKAQAGA